MAIELHHLPQRVVLVRHLGHQRHPDPFRHQPLQGLEVRRAPPAPGARDVEDGGRGAQLEQGPGRQARPRRHDDGPVAHRLPRHLQRVETGAIDLHLRAGPALEVDGARDERHQRRADAAGGAAALVQDVEGGGRAAGGDQRGGQASGAGVIGIERERAAQVARGRLVVPLGGERGAHGLVQRRAVLAIGRARGLVLVLDHLALAARGHERRGHELGGQAQRLLRRRERPRRVRRRRGQRLRGQRLRLLDGGGLVARTRRPTEQRRRGTRPRLPHLGLSFASLRSASSKVSLFLQNAKRTWRRPSLGSR